MSKPDTTTVATSPATSNLPKAKEAKPAKKISVFLLGQADSNGFAIKTAESILEFCSKKGLQVKIGIENIDGFKQSLKDRYEDNIFTTESISILPRLNQAVEKAILAGKSPLSQYIKYEPGRIKNMTDRIMKQVTDVSKNSDQRNAVILVLPGITHIQKLYANLAINYAKNHSVDVSHLIMVKSEEAIGSVKLLKAFQGVEKSEAIQNFCKKSYPKFFFAKEGADTTVFDKAMERCFDHVGVETEGLTPVISNHVQTTDIPKSAITGKGAATAEKLSEEKEESRGYK